MYCPMKDTCRSSRQVCKAVYIELEMNIFDNYVSVICIAGERPTTGVFAIAEAAYLLLTTDVLARV